MKSIKKKSYIVLLSGSVTHKLCLLDILVVQKNDRDYVVAMNVIKNNSINFSGYVK